MSEEHVQRNRLPDIRPEDRTWEQLDAIAKLAATPRGGLRGPFQVLLYSPELLNRSQSLGAFLRYECSLPQTMRELAILVTARFWNQGYEWALHAPIARQAGLSTAIIAAVANREPLLVMDKQTEATYRFCESIHHRHFVPDPIYSEAMALFGEKGVVELSAICGYYALLAMIMNIARTPVPGDADVPFPTPEDLSSGEHDHAGA